MIDAIRTLVSTVFGLNNSPKDLTNRSNDDFDIIAGSPDRRIAGSPDRRVAGSPGRRVAGSRCLRPRDGHERVRMVAPAGPSVLRA